MIKQIADYDDRAGGDNEIAGLRLSQRLIQRLSHRVCHRCLPTHVGGHGYKLLRRG